MFNQKFLQVLSALCFCILASCDGVQTHATSHLNYDWASDGSSYVVSANNHISTGSGYVSGARDTYGGGSVYGDNSGSGSCTYQWQRDSAGRRCGGRADEVRPGGSIDGDGRYIDAQGRERNYGPNNDLYDHAEENTPRF